MTDRTPLADQQLNDLHQQLTGPLGTATDVCGGTALRLVAEVRDHRAVQPIALPARWECSHGPSDDEAYCLEAEDEDHVCPTIRVHPSDAEVFAALVARAGQQLKPEADAIHRHFGLTYANYLVLPRTFLQSMDDEWQTGFVALLDRLNDAFAHVPQAEGYKVEAATEHEVSDLDEAQRQQLGITADWHRGETPPDGLSPEDLAEWQDEHEDPEGPAYSRDGEELDPDSRVMLSAADPVPHYNRGRAYIAPALAETGE
jgi:hypothetical protein